jgi:hypothetical protein
MPASEKNAAPKMNGMRRSMMLLMVDVQVNQK